MAYKIAVATTDGKRVNVSFGGAFQFEIYEVDGHTYRLLEKRGYILPQGAAPEALPGNTQCVDGHCQPSAGCGTGAGCGAGGTFPKVKLIEDCRCVICQKIGFNITKQLEKLAITGFDVDCTIEEALKKITYYLEKVDGHQSLRGFAKQR